MRASWEGCLVEWQYTLPPDADSVAEARDHVRHALGACADDEKLGCIELVVSELVTNSIRHGPGLPIVLRLAVDAAGDISGEVEDQGDGVIEISRRRADTAVGGLGLPLVDHLTTSWGVYPGSTHVWFRFAAAA